MKKLFIVVFHNKTGNPVKALPIFGETQTSKAINEWADEQRLGEIEPVTEESLFRCVVPTKVHRLDWTNRAAVVIFPQTERFTAEFMGGVVPSTTSVLVDSLGKSKRPRNSIKGEGYVRPLGERETPNFEGIERPKG